MLATTRDAASGIVDATRPSQWGLGIGPGSGLKTGFNNIPYPVPSEVAVICYARSVHDSTSTTTTTTTTTSCNALQYYLPSFIHKHAIEVALSVDCHITCS